MPSAFVDTNILVYAASNHPIDREKRLQARQLLLNEDVAISFQVLQEFYANAIHPHKLGYSLRQAVKLSEAWMLFPVCALDAALFVETMRLAVHHRISNWDAAILAAALQLGCSLLFSEDFQHGRKYESVQVINPFL
jgi:predicted nucleic acid-binding protein